MDNFEHLSQEELLEAAQKAYEEQTQNAVPTKDAPCEEEQPTVEEPALEQEESIVAEEEPAREELEETPSLPATVSKRHRPWHCRRAHFWRWGWLYYR